MMRQRRHTFPRSQIPQFDGRIIRSRNNLRICPFRQNRTDRIVMSRQTVNLMLRPHIPNPRHGIPPAGDQQIQRRMEFQRKHPRQMSVIMSNDLIGLQIPTLDHFILRRREEVGMPLAEGQSADGADVSGEGNFEGIVGSHAGFGEVEYFDDAVASSGGEEGVGGVEGDGADPAEVGGEDGGEFPGGVPGGGWDGGGVVFSFHQNSTRTNRPAFPSTLPRSCSCLPTSRQNKGAIPRHRRRRSAPGRSLEQIRLPMKYQFTIRTICRRSSKRGIGTDIFPRTQTLQSLLSQFFHGPHSRRLLATARGIESLVFFPLKCQILHFGRIE
mmetsp:Transcript_20831/g.42466  ORF Transcript_20831/g.42466 Transcript_20831/m.42466 type:complete len:327 (-) Transcript_20831:259-1239(-)